MNLQLTQNRFDFNILFDKMEWVFGSWSALQMDKVFCLHDRKPNFIHLPSIMLKRAQQRFFGKSIKIKEVRDCISSPLEYEFKEVLNAAGLKEEEDYFHQAAFTDDDRLVAVADFSIPKIKMIIELDGKSHSSTKQAKKDVVRDGVFIHNYYQTIRIKVPLTNEQKSYWKSFIKYSFDD